MCETALSDFHKLVVTVLKSTFPKSHSKIIKYRSYRHFSNNLLRDNFKNHLLNKQNMTLEFTSFTRFTRILIETRNKHAPIKKNIIVESTQILLHKAYRAIMLRSRTVSPLFDNKVKTNHKINLNERIFYQHLVRRLLKHLKSISMKLCQSFT